MSEATEGRIGPDIFVPSSTREDRKIQIGSVASAGTRRPWDYAAPTVHGDDMPEEHKAFNSTRALDAFDRSLPSAQGDFRDLRSVLTGLAIGRPMNVGGTQFDSPKMREALHKAAEPANAFAREWRDHPRWYQTTAPGQGGGRRDFIDPRELAKTDPLAKAVLDVGTSQNFTVGNVTGGQSLGFFSLDTRVARATVRPDSFTLYQALGKSAAFQVVDYWPYIDDPGGALPGSATSGFSNVQSGTLATNAGFYSLNSVNLKLMLDGRAMTIALAAQNSFVSIQEQENANAALTVLGTADWLCYHGNSTTFTNQFNGLGATTPTANIFDFQQFFAANASINSWSNSQTLYNMIYEVAAAVTSWGRFGRITHAFMTPATAGALQSLVTTLLNNIVAGVRENVVSPGIVVDGDLQGMRTRMGPIQFPMDLMITARDIPAQGQPRANGTTPASSSAPTPPASIALSLSGAAYAGSNWGVGSGSPYASGSTGYHYAVASTDINMNESTLVWSTTTAAGSGITSSGAVSVAITGPANSDASAFRVFRTGSLGFASGSNSATAVRYIGSIAANATNASGVVTFVDSNALIPGAERIYLLDLRGEDSALDFRYLLPLTRIELFAQNLYAPWAVAMIGAMRNRIPRFHAIISNFIPDSPTWNPLGSNA